MVGRRAKRGVNRALPASEAALAPPIELCQVSEGAAPSLVQGWNPCRGARGAEPPGKFLIKLTKFH